MTSWFMVEMILADRKPTSIEIIRLNRALKAIDCNVTNVFEKSIFLSPWYNLS